MNLFQFFYIQSALAEVGLRRVEDLQEQVDKLSANIQRAKAKILGQEPAPIETEVQYLEKFMALPIKSWMLNKQCLYLCTVTRT